jgi:hypothetical protein
MPEWRAMLREAFDQVQFRGIETEAARNRAHLTDEIRSELAGYSEDELLTTTVIAVAKKS